MGVYKYREEWLEAAVNVLRPMFLEKDLYVPENVKVSCGWPRPNADKNVLGTCFHSDCSKGHLREIFITPLKGHNNVFDRGGVLAVLIHELCHACFDHDEKHGPNFARAAKDMGLEWRRITATVLSDSMISRLRSLFFDLGEYPQPGMVPIEKPKRPRVIRTHTLKCANDNYEIKIHEDHLAKGTPKCPVCGEDFIKQTPEN